MPLLLALSAIAFPFSSSFIDEAAVSLFEPIYRANKEVELKNNVTVAEQAIAPFHESDNMDDALMDKVKDVLRKLEFGDDRRFFLLMISMERFLYSPINRKGKEKFSWIAGTPMGHLLFKS